MRLFYRATFAAAALVFAHTPAAAQNTSRFHLGIGAAVSVITGTPEREPPQSGERITGASGPETGSHYSVTAEYQTSYKSLRWAGSFVSNRLTTSRRTLNCVHDSEVNLPGKICYIGADLDRMQGVITGPLIRIDNNTLDPFLGITVGAGRFHLTWDDPATPESVDRDANHILPIYSVTTGVVVSVRFIELRLSGGLEGGTGRGAGTTHIPLGITLVW